MRRPSLDLSEPSRNLEESLPSPNTAAEPTSIMDLSLTPAAAAGEEDEGEEGGQGQGRQGLDTLEEQDSADDDGRAGHHPRIYTPPPHIAARFYRPSQTRRRDSAASSRRNSISSAHSRSSHAGAAAGCSRSGGGGHGPQSKHIAQHLRRASILEDRKARLADRAAHAEKVRLRAAIAKSASRDTSLSEERAIAAQLARERNLAEIAAACAEEVKRAKAVAESMKEKREQEIRKLRSQIEERLAEAKRRREELRSRSAAARARGRSGSESGGAAGRKSAGGMLPDVKEESIKESPEPATEPESELDSLLEAPSPRPRPRPPLSADAAAERIQWWWRAAGRRAAVAEFQQLGLTIDGVRATTFEEVVKLLAQEPVLLVTSKILRICGLQEGPVGSVGEMAAVRTFLSAFLILGHPAQVLSNKDDREGQEQVVRPPASPSPLSQAQHLVPLSKDDLANPQLQELVGKAGDLLICFESILPRLTPLNSYTPPPALKASLPESYAAFHNAFIAWKARDSSALIDVMLMQFVELDAIWQTVKDSTDPSVTESYRKSIQDNQVMLLVRIKKLAGQEQGKKMVFEAVRKARKTRAENRVAGDTKPREAADHTVETAMGDLAAAEEPHPSLSQAGTSTAHAAAAAMSSGASSPSPSPSPPQYLTVEVRIPRNRLLPDNRVVVHELAINKQYRLSAEEYREQQTAFLEPVLRQMRATMSADDQEEHFMLLLEVAKDIRAKLQRLVQPGKSMHAFIGEVLDTDVAYQQFLTGSFSYEKFFSIMAQLLPKLCAPVRDDEVRELVEGRLRSGDYVDRLEALMGFIDVMSSDHANYLLSLAAPQILQSAPQYERKYFAQSLEKGEHGLARAEDAWRQARLKVLGEAGFGQHHHHQQPATRSRPTPDRIYTQVLVDVFTRLGPTAAGADGMPEMLRLDHRRAVRCGALTRRVVTAGTVLLQCKNMLKRDVRVPWRNEALRVLAVLEAADARREQLMVTHEAEAQGDAGGAVAAEDHSTTVDGVMAALEAGRCMPEATRRNLRLLVGRMVAAGAEASRPGSPDPTEPVLRLLLSRLRAHMLSRLAAVSTSDKVRGASTAGERLASLGLAEFVDRVREMVDEIARVGAVDREAHSAWWEAVADRVEREDCGSSSSFSNTSSS